MLKLNFDGRSKGNPRQVGFGCVLRDHSDKVVRVISGPLGMCDSTTAEAMGLLFGLRELKQLGIKDCVVEGNSMTVIRWEYGKGDGSWCLAQIVNEI